MTNIELATILRFERNRLRREMEKYVAEHLMGDPYGSYRVGIIEGMSMAVRMLTSRIYELEESHDPSNN